MSAVTTPIVLDTTVQDLITATINAATNNVTAINNARDANIQALNTGMSTCFNALVEVLASVKSVNGKYGIVVLDSGDILIQKNDVNSKTIKQTLTEMGNAIADTPLDFSATLISGSETDYRVVITQGTPS